MWRPHDTLVEQFVSQFYFWYKTKFAGTHPLVPKWIFSSDGRPESQKQRDLEVQAFPEELDSQTFRKKLVSVDTRAVVNPMPQLVL